MIILMWDWPVRLAMMCVLHTFWLLIGRPPEAGRLVANRQVRQDAHGGLSRSPDAGLRVELRKLIIPEQSRPQHRVTGIACRN